MIKQKISAVDLFCGIGGLSFGLKESGIQIKAGIDFDDSCKYAYETNCNSEFIYADVSSVKKEDINKALNFLKFQREQITSARGNSFRLAQCQVWWKHFYTNYLFLGKAEPKMR